MLRRWMSLQVDLGNFDSRGAVYNFALKMTFRAVLLAFLFNIAVLPLGYALGLMPLSLADAVKLSVAGSWLFGGAVSGALALLTGHVIRELSVSRAEFERLSRTDMLSGLLNRRAFNAARVETGPGASLAILEMQQLAAQMPLVMGERDGTGDRLFGRPGGEMVCDATHGFPELVIFQPCKNKRQTARLKFQPSAWTGWPVHWVMPREPGSAAGLSPLSPPSRSASSVSWTTRLRPPALAR